jgi:hypothetical protein
VGGYNTTELDGFPPFRVDAKWGKCRTGERLLPRSRERGPATMRDEGPGETEGVSPGAFSRGVSGQTKQFPNESLVWGELRNKNCLTL